MVPHSHCTLHNPGAVPRRCPQPHLPHPTSPLPMLSAHRGHAMTLAACRDLSTVLPSFWRTLRASPSLPDHADKTKSAAARNLPARISPTLLLLGNSKIFHVLHYCLLASCWEHQSIANPTWGRECGKSPPKHTILSKPSNFQWKSAFNSTLAHPSCGRIFTLGDMACPASPSLWMNSDTRQGPETPVGGKKKR